MLDQIDYTIAKKLADRHLYPFAQQIYTDIFRSFSHFPVDLNIIKIKHQGVSITFLAFVVQTCFLQKYSSFTQLYETVLNKMKNEFQTYVVQDVTVETLLGCILYYYHPSNLRQVLSSGEFVKNMNEHEKYEYGLKKNTMLLHIL